MNRLEELKERIYKTPADIPIYVFIPRTRIWRGAEYIAKKWEKARVLAYSNRKDLILFAYREDSYELYPLSAYNFKTVEEMEEENE